MSDVNARRAARFLGISREELHRYTVDGLVRAARSPDGAPRYTQAELDRVHDVLDATDRRVL